MTLRDNTNLQDGKRIALLLRRDLMTPHPETAAIDFSATCRRDPAMLKSRQLFMMAYAGAALSGFMVGFLTAMACGVL